MRKLLQNGRSTRGFLFSLLVLGAFSIGLTLAGPVLRLYKSPPGSSYSVAFGGDSESYYEIWSSDALGASTDWQRLGMLLGEEGELSWSDARPVSASERYYRITQRSKADPGDADGDGINDLYELTRGMNPLAADVAAVESVTVASAAIAAGAVETAPHQTVVHIQVSPRGAYPVAVWLEGGDGFGVGTGEHFAGGTFPRAGAAKIAGDGQVFVAGGDNPSSGSIVVTTDAAGSAELVLTSSNEIGEQCTVHARMGTATDLGGGQAHSLPVTFEEGELVVTFPTTLVAGAPALAEVRRSYNGQLLEGHDIVFYVNRVRLAGQALTVDPGQPGGLDAYASVDPNDIRVITDEAGGSVAGVMIHDVGGLEYVEVKAEDLQVFGE